MGRCEKVSPIRIWGLLVLIHSSTFGSAIYSNKASSVDYTSKDWDLNYDGAGTSVGYWDHYFEDDTKLLAGGPGSENIRGESSNFYNSLGSKHNPYFATRKQSPREKSVKDERTKEPAHTGSSHILSVFPSPVQSKPHFITPPKEKTFSITSQTQNPVKDDSSKVSNKKQVVAATTDMDDLSIKENHPYENRHPMKVRKESGKQEQVLLRTPSNSPSILKIEGNAHVYRNNNVDTRSSLKGYHSTEKAGKVFYSTPLKKSSSYNKRTMDSSKGFPSLSKLAESRSEKENQSNETETNPNSEFAKYTGGEKENKSPRRSILPFSLPYPIPFPYVRRGSKENTYKEAGREAENTNEMAIPLLQPFLNGAEVILQRRNRSKRDSPDVEAFSSQNGEMVQDVDSSLQANHQSKSVEGVTTEPMSESSGVATNVKNSTPPPQATNPIEALQRLTRLLDRMLRELSRFQQKFTLRLIRMTERQDIDQMQQIMQDFDISPDKPIFFIAGGLKTLNGSVRLSSIVANLTQILSTNESVADGIEQAISSSVTEGPLLSPAETTSAPILIPLQGEATPLPVELEEAESSTAAQVQAEPDTVIITNREDMNHVDLITAQDTPVNSNRQKRSTPDFDDFQVFPIPGRSARTENPYDDFGEAGWIDFSEVRNGDVEYVDSVYVDENDKPVGKSADEYGEFLLHGQSEFIASKSAIDQSHAKPEDDLISSNSEHANTAVGVAISEPVMPIEKTSVVPLSTQHPLTLNVTNDIVPLNDSVTTVKEQQAIRSNDHGDDQTQAAASTNIVNRTPPYEPPSTSNSVAETAMSSEMEDKNKNIVNGKGESLNTVLQNVPDKSPGNIGKESKTTTFVDMAEPAPGNLIVNADNNDAKNASGRAIESEPINNAIPLESAKIPTSEPSHIASGENHQRSNETHPVPIISTPTKEQSGMVHISLSTAKANPADDSKAPHSLSIGTDPILESNLDIHLGQAGMNVKNSNPPPQLNITAKLMMPQQIKTPTHGIVKLPSIENRTDDQVLDLPLLETTVTGLNINTAVNKDMQVSASKIPFPESIDNVAFQDIISAVSPTMATSAVGELTTEKKSPPEIIPLVGEGESGTKSFSLGEKENIPLGRESVMKKVEGKVEQQDTNIGKEIEKVSPNQTTFHAPTVLESSQIIGNNNATFLPDKPSPNAISIHNNVSQAVLIQDEITDKSVRKTETVPFIDEETLGETSQDIKNFGRVVRVPGTKSTDVQVLFEAGLTNLAAKNVIPQKDNDILTQPGVNASPTSQLLESHSSDFTPTEKSQQEFPTASEKGEIVPELGVEEGEGLTEGVDKMKVPSNHAEPLIDKVVPTVVQHTTSEPTSGLIQTILNPVSTEVDPIEPVRESKTPEISQSSLPENVSGGTRDQVVKISNEPDVLLPLVNNDRVKGEGVVPTKPVILAKIVVPTASAPEEATKAVAVQAQEIIQTKPNDVENAAPFQVVSNSLVPSDDKIIQTSVEGTITSGNATVIESADPIISLGSNIVPTTTLLQGSQNSHGTDSPSIPVALDENITAPLSASPTGEINQVVPATSEPVTVPIALVPYEEEAGIPTLPETDLDTAFQVKPIATTPNFQIPGLKPSIPERPRPDYVDLISHGVDVDSLYISPPATPIVLSSPPVFSGYSPAAILHRQQQLMNRYFAGLLYRRALPY